LVSNTLQPHVYNGHECQDSLDATFLQDSKLQLNLYSLKQPVSNVKPANICRQMWRALRVLLNDMEDEQGERGCLKKVQASRATIRPTQASDWDGYLWIAGVPTTDDEAVAGPAGRMSLHEESCTKHACKSSIRLALWVPVLRNFKIQMKAWKAIWGDGRKIRYC
jgi:hypothetical protein